MSIIQQIARHALCLVACFAITGCGPRYIQRDLYDGLPGPWPTDPPPGIIDSIAAIGCADDASLDTVAICSVGMYENYIMLDVIVRAPDEQQAYELFKSLFWELDGCAVELNAAILAYFFAPELDAVTFCMVNLYNRGERRTVLMRVTPIEYQEGQIVYFGRLPIFLATNSMPYFAIVPEGLSGRASRFPLSQFRCIDEAFLTHVCDAHTVPSYTGSDDTDPVE